MNDTNGNGNDNGNAHAEEVLTIAEAVKRLNTTEPRLRRLLQRPEFAPRVRQMERRTQTGTRVSSVIPVSIIALLQEAIDSGSTSEPGTEAERERTRNTNGDAHAQEDSIPVRVTLLESQQSEIAFLRQELERQREREQGEVSFLRSQLEQRDVAESELRRLLLVDRQEITRLREQLAIAAAPVEPQDALLHTQNGNNAPVKQEVHLPVQEPSPMTTGAVGEGQEVGTVNQPQHAPEAVQKQPEPRRRAWWKIWERKE